jgi:hypothetical protein
MPTTTGDSAATIANKLMIYFVTILEHTRQNPPKYMESIFFVPFIHSGYNYIEVILQPQLFYLSRNKN